jgi:hypothetical protein
MSRSLCGCVHEPKPRSACLTARGSAALRTTERRAADSAPELRALGAWPAGVRDRETGGRSSPGGTEHTRPPVRHRWLGSVA